MKDRIGIVIPSRNRPLQLEALLRSLRMFDTNNIIKPHVLYCYTDGDYARGYDIVRNLYPEVNFTLETSFEHDFRRLLNETVNNHAYVGLGTDDCLFYRKFDVSSYDLHHLFDSIGVG